MPWNVEVSEGPALGRKLDLKPGQTLTVGRTERAAEIFAEDQWMSSLHFAVGVSGGVVRFQNLSKTNGTEINGQRLEEGVLQAGDRVKAGGTTFTVQGPPPSPFPAQMRVGGWAFESIPSGWQKIEGLGIQLPVDGAFQATLSAVEEALPDGKTLADYVQTQIDLTREHLKDASIEGPVGIKMRGSSEALALTIRSATPQGEPVIQRQIYALSSDIVGVFTATMLVPQSEKFREPLSSLVRGLSFFQG